MTVSEVALSEDGQTARIWVRPSWFARLFGARDCVVELVRSRVPSSYGWESATTGRCIRQHEHYWLLMSALESQPVARKPITRVPLAIARPRSRRP